MEIKKQENPQNTEATTPEKKGFTNRQKIITAMSGVALTAVFVIGGSIALNNESQNDQSILIETPINPIEQSVIKNSSNDFHDVTTNNSSSTETIDALSEKTNPVKPKIDMGRPSVPTKDCPDLKDASCAVIYIDPGSGETVVNMPNQTPEKADYSGDGIIMLGFSKLIDDYGMTFDQVTKLQSEFSDYSSSQKTPLQEISITLASVKTTVNPDTGITILEFDTTIDRSSILKASVESYGIDNPVLKLYDSGNNQQIYSSK